jgi:hypothetical protein
MRTHSFQFVEDDYECDAVKRQSPELAKYKKQYETAKTQAEKDDINLSTGRIVIILESIQATEPACYEYVSRRM